MNRSWSSRIVAVFASSVALAFAAACLPPAPAPIDTLRYGSGAASGSRMLLVFLPGRGDDMEAFQAHGLLDAVRAHGLDADVAAVNAHMGYYLNGMVFTRIKEDVIEPARARGYGAIWMVGASLGGYGSLSYARLYPGDIDGIVLLGPYLGEQEMIDEIRGAGGIGNWRPRVIENNSKDQWDKELWLWIRDTVAQEPFGSPVAGCGPERMPCGPAIYLGYGRSDRFSPGQEFMASLMPSGHVLAIDGGHRWGAWKELWTMFLDRNIFAGVMHSAPAGVERRP